MIRALGRLGLVALSGAMVFLATADWDVWPLAWVALLPLVAVTERAATPRRAFLYGWLMGTVTNAGGFPWILGLLERFGHLPTAAALPIFLLLVGYQGLVFGLLAWLLVRLRARLELPMALALPVTLVGLELLVPFVFPWYLAITQAWVGPVIQVAELAGPLGVSFLVAMVNGALFDLLEGRLAGGARRAPRWRPAAVAAGVLAAALAFGALRLHQVDARRAAAPHRRVGLVQANIGIVEKWLPGARRSNLEAHQRLSAELERRGAQLIVWPESAYPYALGRELEADLPESDGRRARRGFAAPLLLGAVTVGRTPDEPFPFNSALMLDRSGQVTGRFDKNFLLIFGEYLPLYERLQALRAGGGLLGRLPDLRELIPESSHFAHGTEVTTFPFDGFRLGPMICYEDILPAFGRRLGRLHPHLLVNITNDAWFGATAEPWEHLALAVFRAVELRVELVRAVNTGVSVHVDAAGRVRARTRAVDPQGSPKPDADTLLADVALVEGGHTLYAAVGDLFGVLDALALALLVAVAWRRERRGAAKRRPGP